MGNAADIVSVVEQHLNPNRFREQHWEGAFSDYLELVAANPRVARNAFQRIYDMIMYFGCKRYTSLRQELQRYNFVADPIDRVDTPFLSARLPLTARTPESISMMPS